MAFYGLALVFNYPHYMATIERESQMTERGRYRFTVKKHARGEYWIAAEPAGNTIESLDDCVLGFEIEPKATHGHAVTVADFLNSNIVAITLT